MSIFLSQSASVVSATLENTGTLEVEARAFASATNDVHSDAYFGEEGIEQDVDGGNLGTSAYAGLTNGAMQHHFASRGDLLTGSFFAYGEDNKKPSSSSRPALHPPPRDRSPHLRLNSYFCPKADPWR